MLFMIASLLLIFASCITINIPDKDNSGSGKILNQQPVVYIDSINPAKASLGDPVTFSGHGTDYDGTIIGYEWRSSIDRMLSTTNSFSTASLTVGTHTISFRVLDNSNLWSLETNSVVVVTPKVAKPVIESFVAFPGSIVRGGSFELRWNVSGATAVSIDNGIGQVAATGSRIVYPSASTLYTLTASNAGASITDTASVTVLESATVGNPVITFNATHLGGTSWRLNWNVLYATQIVIEPDIGPVNPAGSTVVTISSGQVKTYKLTAINTWGWAYWQVVLAAP